MKHKKYTGDIPKVNKEYITLKKSGIHNKGVFAKVNISKGVKVIEYVGEKISKAESDKRADKEIDNHKKNSDKGAVYIFELNKKTDVDGNVSWNPARFINHSCDPNCEAEITRGRIWIISIRDIKKGEEITYNYNYDIDDFDEHPCRCQSERCVGYILDEDKWPKLKRKLAKDKLALDKK